MGSAMYFVSSSPAFIPFYLFSLFLFRTLCFSVTRTCGGWPWIGFSFTSGMDKGRRESMIEV